jgi:hypothetical protein
MSSAKRAAFSGVSVYFNCSLMCVVSSAGSSGTRRMLTLAADRRAELPRAVERPRATTYSAIAGYGGGRAAEGAAAWDSS